jgi:hypothetical protein
MKLAGDAVTIKREEIRDSVGPALPRTRKMGISHAIQAMGRRLAAVGNGQLCVELARHFLIIIG